uniref:Uncharacterized protein n=1 Tax=Anguilla anguilla TaxID=7936 RepID=A0A0E9R0K2_ANGAN
MHRNIQYVSHLTYFYSSEQTDLQTYIFEAF